MALSRITKKQAEAAIRKAHLNGAAVQITADPRIKNPATKQGLVARLKDLTDRQIRRHERNKATVLGIASTLKT